MSKLYDCGELLKELDLLDDYAGDSKQVIKNKNGELTKKQNAYILLSRFIQDNAVTTEIPL